MGHLGPAVFSFARYVPKDLQPSKVVDAGLSRDYSEPFKEATEVVNLVSI